MSLHLILLICAAVSFACATFGVAARVNLIGLGLLFWVLTQIV